MLDLSVEKLAILAVAALFILGPERLPTVAATLARTIRQIKNYTTQANHQLRRELGPEFDEIRALMNNLRSDLADLQTWQDPHHDPPPTAPNPTPNPHPANSPPLTARQRPPIDLDAT
jgi:sec-independent protein translocase protein TatB